MEDCKLNVSTVENESELNVRDIEDVKKHELKTGN